MTLLLRRSQVAELLDLSQAMAVMEQTFREQAQGAVRQVPPLRFMNRGMRLVAGGLEAQNRNGLRVSVTGGDSFALLFEISSGELLAVMGYPFSHLRISATVGLAIERLADPKAKRVALIGSGRLALPILEPVAALRTVEQIVVYSRSRENREAFAARAKEKLNVPIRAAALPEDAVREAHVVLVSTNASEPALHGKWLRPGQSIFGVGRPNEFDDEVYLAAHRICVTSKIHETGYYDTRLDQPLLRLSRQKRLSWDDVIEFGDVVAGKTSVPDGAKSIVVFRDSQGGYGDLALASWVYDRARREGLGQVLSLE